MKFINTKRGSGKTLMLIHTAYVTGLPIIVDSWTHKQYILKLAKHEGLDNIKVHTIGEYKNNRLYNDDRYSQVLIDDCEYIIQLALKQYLGVDVAAATMTIPIEGKSMDLDFHITE